MSKIFNMKFATIYPLYLQKIEKKGRTKQELDTVLTWLLGYEKVGLEAQINGEATLEELFAAAPEINPNAHLITGTICGHRVENIEDPLMQNIRRMDKLVDELAKGRVMEKILRV